MPSASAPVDVGAPKIADMGRSVGPDPHGLERHLEDPTGGFVHPDLVAERERVEVAEHVVALEVIAEHRRRRHADVAHDPDPHPGGTQPPEDADHAGRQLERRSPDRRRSAPSSTRRRRRGSVTPRAAAVSAMTSLGWIVHTGPPPIVEYRGLLLHRSGDVLGTNRRHRDRSRQATQASTRFSRCGRATDGDQRVPVVERDPRRVVRSPSQRIDTVRHGGLARRPRPPARPRSCRTPTARCSRR